MEKLMFKTTSLYLSDKIINVLNTVFHPIIAISSKVNTILYHYGILTTPKPVSFKNTPYITKLISIKLTYKEYNTLQSLAKESSVSMHAFISDLIIEFKKTYSLTINDYDTRAKNNIQNLKFEGAKKREVHEKYVVKIDTPNKIVYTRLIDIFDRTLMIVRNSYLPGFVPLYVDLRGEILTPFSSRNVSEVYLAKNLNEYYLLTSTKEKLD